MRAMSDQIYQSPGAMGTLPLTSTATWLRHGLATIQHLMDRQRQRRALLDLDTHMLEDIGATRAEALEEAHKPFWK